MIIFLRITLEGKREMLSQLRSGKCRLHRADLQAELFFVSSLLQAPRVCFLVLGGIPFHPATVAVSASS